MSTVSITCSECEKEFDVEEAKLKRVSNGSSGSHTTSYTTSGEVECPHCESLNEVDDTGEVLTIDFF